jgi:exopolysaccharide biosynthesis protein
MEAWPVMPALTSEGYLSPDAGMEEFIHADVENGLWIYVSDGLRIQIQRFTDPNMPLIWYEADIRTNGEEKLHSVPANPRRLTSIFKNPEDIAKTNHVVFALNDDQFIQRKTDKRVVGIIIRNGKVYNSTTRRSGSTIFPTLDTMALFPDGSLRVYESKEHTAQEYIDMGATDVFAFGPVLIRDGVVSERLSELFVNSIQPRSGFGMVDKNHYVCVVAEGRHTGTAGASLLWLANRLYMLGVTQAFNLDGGNTSAMMFMGEKLNANNNVGPDANVRSISGIIAIGESSKVPPK